MYAIADITVDEIKQALPAPLKRAASQELADKINKITTDPEFAGHIKQNFISYTSVLMDGKFKTEDYINAVTYVSYKLMGFTNKDAYSRTFPTRYQTLTIQGRTDKEISAYVSAYNKTKLVNLILEQTIIPSWVLNQDKYQAAINTQFDLMQNAISEKVRTEAANSLLTHLKKPETKKVELDIGVKENSGMAELREAMTSLAQQQRELIEAGAQTKTIAHQKIVPSNEEIEATAKDVTPQED